MFSDYPNIFKNTRKQIGLGVSYMIPVVLVGGLFFAFYKLLGGASGGELALNLRAISNIGMELFVPVLAAYISYAIADRVGIAPGLICGALATSIGAGFLGGLVAGLLSGYITFFLVKKVKVPESIRTVWWMYIPVIVSLILGLLIIYVIGPPITALTNAITNWLTEMSTGNLILLGLILGAMQGVDFGGPINKIAFLFALGALEKDITIPMGLVMGASTVPSIGMCLATFFAPKLYSKQEQEFGKAALAIGVLSGFSEGAIPFAVNDVVRVMIATTLGSAVAGAMAGFFGLMIPAPGNGIIGMWLFNKPFHYVICTIVGALVCALTVNLLKKMSKRDVTVTDEAVS